MYPAINQSHRRITIRLRSPNADFLKHHPNKGIPDDKFSILKEEFPDYLASKSRIEMMLPVSHPDLLAIIEKANALNLNIEPDSSQQSQVEIMDYTKYTSEDICTSKFLECQFSIPKFDCYLDIIDKDIKVSHDKIHHEKNRVREYGTLTNLPHLLFIRGKVKQYLETAGLKGLELRKVSFSDDGCCWPDDVDPLYLLWSSVKQPYSNLLVYNNDGQTLKSIDCDKGFEEENWYPLDNHEVRPLLEYKASVRDVDISLSREQLYGGGEYYRRIIYSQKAKSVLEEIGMELECVPVRLNTETNLA